MSRLHDANRCELSPDWLSAAFFCSCTSKSKASCGAAKQQRLSGVHSTMIWNRRQCVPFATPLRLDLHHRLFFAPTATLASTRMRWLGRKKKSTPSAPPGMPSKIGRTRHYSTAEPNMRRALRPARKPAQSTISVLGQVTPSFSSPLQQKHHVLGITETSQCNRRHIEEIRAG